MPRRGLDRAQVVDAAVAIADADGLEAVTLSRVAAALGVKPPSLYNHVDGRGALVRAIALRALGESPTPSAPRPAAPARTRRRRRPRPARLCELGVSVFFFSGAAGRGAAEGVGELPERRGACARTSAPQPSTWL